MNKIDLDQVLNLIEQKFGRGSSENWKNRDFEDLNFEILKLTKINISAHTLKRVFGKIKTDEYYLPQKATLIALKKYVDFKNPEKIEPKIFEVNKPNSLIEKQEIGNKYEKRSIRLIAIISIALFVGIFTTYFVLSENKNIQSSNLGVINLLSTEGRIPKSCEFEYSTPDDKDSFRICFDGNFEPIPVASGKRMKATYYYQYPGFFKVRMWKKNSIVSETTPVYVPTNGWEAFGMYHMQKQLEHIYPINVSEHTVNGNFSPNKNDIHNIGMDTSKLVEVRMENYKPSGIIGDNFTLKTTLKNSDVWSGSTCNSVFLVVTGRKESIKLHFTNPGCSYWVRFRLSEKKLSNKNDNLSNFVFNLAEWQHLRIENRNKQISIFVNNIKRYTNSYDQSIGEIMGVTVIFQGNGYLKEYQLSDLNGNTLYQFPEGKSQSN